MRPVHKIGLLSLGLLGANLSVAATLDVMFDIPRMEGQRYARPYVAVWAEAGHQSRPLLVWHAQDKQDNWLPDVRRWWRKLGRYDAYTDGITGATQGPGTYHQQFTIDDWEQFKLYFEVVRENGGRTLLSEDIDLNSEQTRYHIPAERELGRVSILVSSK